MSTFVLKGNNKAKLSLRKGTPKDRPLEGFPIVISNGHTQWESLDFLLFKYMTKRLSMGTIATYAYSLSILFKYLNQADISVDQMDDGSLVGYRNYLLAKEIKAQSSQINKHIRTTIDFLLWIEKTRRDFAKQRQKLIAISTEEEYVPAQVNVYVDSYRGRPKGNFHDKIHHEAFLTPSIPRLRKPIPEDTLEKIWAAIPVVCKGSERQLRNEIALTLLEFLGARQSEIFAISVSDAVLGIETSQIRVYTKKREHGHSRMLDLPALVASKLQDYIDFVRTPLINQAIKNRRLKTDHGRLLVTMYGTPWNERSLYNELKILEKEAGIKTSISAHLFRHTHFTLLTQRLRDLDEHKIRLILKKRGGWRSDRSVETYQHADKFMSPDTIAVTKQINSINNLVAGKREIKELLSCLKTQTLEQNQIGVSEKLSEIEKKLDLL